MRYLVDGDGLVYTYGYAAEKKVDGQVVDLMSIDAVYHLLDMQINSFGEDYKIYLDGGSTYRETIATIKPYKGHRDRGQRPAYYDVLRQYLILEHKAELVVGQEPDDKLGIEMCKDPSNNIICTLDKDLDMIPGMHYNWRKMYQYDISEVAGYRFFFLQCISGDKCDNIPSVYQQLELQGNVELANKLKRGSYLKKAKESLDKLESYATMNVWIQDYYESVGLTEDALLEVGQLLWIRREENEMWEL